MVFALKYPQFVRSLVLSSTVSHIDPMLKLMGASWMSALHNNDADTLFEVTFPANFSEPWIAANQGILDPTRRKYHQMDLKAAEQLMLAFTRVDFTKDLKKISAPALVMVGELDILKGRQYAEIIAREIPGAELILIPEAGHALCLEKPGAFNSALLGFVLKHCEVVA